MSTTLPPGAIPFDPVARAQRRLVGTRRTEDESEDSPIPELIAVQGQEPVSLLDLSVRTAHLTDLPALVRMSHVHKLNQPENALRRFSITREAVRSMAPGRRSRPRIFVACVSDKVVGYVEFQATLPDRRWHAISLSTATGVYAAGPVEDALLRHAITAAGLRGVLGRFSTSTRI